MNLIARKLHLGLSAGRHARGKRGVKDRNQDLFRVKVCTGMYRMYRFGTYRYCTPEYRIAINKKGTVSLIGAAPLGLVFQLVFVSQHRFRNVPCRLHGLLDALASGVTRNDVSPAIEIAQFPRQLIECKRALLICRYI